MIPNYLTHYYRQSPFRTLSDLAPGDADDLVARLTEERSLPFRLTHAEYMPRRRQIEQQIRHAFVEKGGRPTRGNPHYMILGRSPYWEKMEPNVVVVPLAHFPSDIISFTYTDSFYTFSEATLRGRPIPLKPHRRTVYRLHELDEVVREFGMPPGYADVNEEFDVYIEAQIWDDQPLQESLQTSPEKSAI